MLMMPPKVEGVTGMLKFLFLIAGDEGASFMKFPLHHDLQFGENTHARIP